MQTYTRYIMKRILALICSLLVLCSLSACNTENIGDNNSSDPTVTKAEAEYVGVWKAKALKFNSANTTEYRTSVIELFADGSGTYEERDIIWNYDIDTETISFTVVESNVASSLVISQKDGKDVLLYNVNVSSESKYDRTYYRENEYIEDNTPENH